MYASTALVQMPSLTPSRCAAPRSRLIGRSMGPEPRHSFSGGSKWPHTHSATFMVASYHGFATLQPGGDEHQFLCEMLEASLTFAQINVTELLAFEGLSRRLRPWEHYGHRPESGQEATSSAKDRGSSRNEGRRARSFSPKMLAHSGHPDTRNDGHEGGRHRGWGK